MRFQEGLKELSFQAFAPRGDHIRSKGTKDLRVTIGHHLILRGNVFFRSICRARSLHSSGGVSTYSPVAVNRTSITPTFHSDPSFRTKKGHPVRRSIMFNGKTIIHFNSRVFRGDNRATSSLLPIRFFHHATMFFHFRSYPNNARKPKVFRRFLEPRLFLSKRRRLPFRF